MQIIEKNIALLLLLVFVLPIGYQSFHQVHHYKVARCEETYYSEQNEQAIFHNEHNEKDCLICEYEFTTCNYHQLFLPAFLIAAVDSISILLQTEHFAVYSGNSVCLRAPPVSHT